MRILIFIFLCLSLSAQLEFLEVETNGLGGVTGIDGAEVVACSPDGRHIYATGAAGNSIAAFSRDAGGTISFIDAYFDNVGGIDGLSGAQGVTVSPDGLDVYVAASAEDMLAHFRRDTVSGSLLFESSYVNGLGGISGMAGPLRIAIDPSGSHLYVTGTISNAIAVFSRTAATGALTFSQSIVDGLGGVNGLAGAVGVDVSPDGGHVYVGGGADNAIAAFTRDLGTGLLTFLTAYLDGSLGVDGIGGINELRVAPDGRSLYASGFSDSAVALFTRDKMTGLLTFVEAEFDGVGGVTGLAGALGVAVSPDSKQVAISGFNGASIVVFERMASGLEYRQTLTDGAGGVEGLAGAVTGTWIPDGTFYYATGFTDDSVSAYETVESLGTLLATALTLGGSGVTVLDLVTYVSLYSSAP